MTSLPVSLPEGFSPVVAEGDSVTTGQVIAKQDEPREETVNIIEGLGLNRKQAGKALQKSPGDSVQKGEAIAIKKNFFGKQTAAIICDINGTIVRYERDTGNLVIKTGDEVTENEIISPVDGTVELCNNKEIVIRTEKAVAGGRVVSGNSNEGEIFILEESFAEDRPASLVLYLDSRAIGKVVLGGNLTRDVLIKGVGIGTAGFVGTSIQDEDIQYFQDRNISIPVLEIDTVSMEKIKKKGKKVRVDVQNKTVVMLQ